MCPIKRTLIGRVEKEVWNMENKNVVTITFDAISNIDELLEKIKELNNALKEAKTLISEIASSSVNIDTVISLDGKEIAKAVRKSNYDNGKESHK